MRMSKPSTQEAKFGVVVSCGKHEKTQYGLDPHETVNIHLILLSNLDS